MQSSLITQHKQNQTILVNKIKNFGLCRIMRDFDEVQVTFDFLVEHFDNKLN